jgi:Ca-activated chloride channel family protein
MKLLAICALLGSLGFAQIQPGQVDPKRANNPDPDADASSPSIGNVTVTNVVAPTTVLDKNGNYINGLTLQDFTLYDKGVPQKISADVSFAPISLVIAVQRSNNLSEILPKIRNDGLLLANNVVGENGEAAVLAFDHEVKLYQDFTDDPAKIEAAMKSLTARGYNSRLNDAVAEGIRMLRSRDKGRRRVLLLISEKRDKASEARVRETLRDAQFANVAIYFIDISSTVTQLTEKPDYPRPQPIPPEATHLPGGAPQTPTSMDQIYNNGNAVPLLQDIYKGVKGLFVDDAADVFTRYTGGKQYTFVKNKTLERVTTALGEELHSQYLLSYGPSNKAEGGYHEIKVVINRPNLEVRTRPGYWSGPLPE